MTIGEFKAWLEGFEEALAGPSPNRKQWARIKERLAEVQPEAKSVYRDGYFRPWWPSWYTYTSTGSLQTGLIGSSTISNQASSSPTMSLNAQGKDSCQINLSTVATQVGRQEAERLN